MQANQLDELLNGAASMLFVGTLFAFAILAWAIYLVPRLSLPLSGFAVLVIGTIFGPYFFSIDGPFAISVDRILWACLLAIFVLFCLLDRTRPIQLNRIDWMIVAFASWLFVSSQMGDPPPTGVPIARWLFYVLMPCGLYVVARFSPISKRDLRAIHGGCVLLGLYLAVTAICETRGLSSVVFPRFIADPETYEFLGRGRGPLLNPSGNGFLLTLTTCAIVLYLQSAGRLGRIGYGLLTLISLGGVYSTLTRSVWIGAALGLTWVQMPRTSRLVRIWMLAGTAMAVVGLAVGFGEQILNMKRDKHLSASAAAESIELRPLLAVIAYEMFKEHPITGVGYGHYFAYNDHYARVSGWEMPLRKASPYMQHNVVLSYLVDSGIVGAGMFIILFVAWGFRAWHLSNSSSACVEARRLGFLMLATLSGYFVNGMFQDVSVIPMVNMFLFYFAGLTVGADSCDGKLPESAPLKRQCKQAIEGMATE